MELSLYLYGVHILPFASHITSELMDITVYPHFDTRQSARWLGINSSSELSSVLPWTPHLTGSLVSLTCKLLDK
jgi:hypothetical protein